MLVVNRVRDADEGIARTNAVAYEPPGSGASTATMGCANSPGRSPSRRAARRRCCLSGRLSATRPRPRGVSWPSSAWYTAPRGCRTRQARPGVSAVDHVASGLGGPTGGINAACPWGRGQWPSRRRPSRSVPLCATGAGERRRRRGRGRGRSTACGAGVHGQARQDRGDRHPRRLRTPAPARPGHPGQLTLSASATPTTHALILGTMDRPARRRQRCAADAASGAVDRMHQMSHQQLAGLDQATPSTDTATS